MRSTPSSLTARPPDRRRRFYVANYREPVTKVRLQDALDQFLESKRRENARPHSITNLRIRVGRLATLNPDKVVSDVLPDHLNALFIGRAELCNSRQ